MFETLPKLATFSYMRFCSQLQRKLKISEMPADFTAIAKAKQIETHRGLWLRREEVWYFNSASIKGKAAWKDKVTDAQVDRWERARSTGTYQMSLGTRQPRATSTSLNVSNTQPQAENYLTFRLQDFDVGVLGLHKTILTNEQCSCTCMGYWHCGYCSHLLFLRFATTVGKMTACKPNRPGRKNDQRSALFLQDSPQLKNAYPSPPPNSKARKQLRLSSVKK